MEDVESMLLPNSEKKEALIPNNVFPQICG
jgi:hypothetical protein